VVRRKKDSRTDEVSLPARSEAAYSFSPSMQERGQKEEGKKCGKKKSNHKTPVTRGGGSQSQKIESNLKLPETGNPVRRTDRKKKKDSKMVQKTQIGKEDFVWSVLSRIPRKEAPRRQSHLEKGRKRR